MEERMQSAVRGVADAVSRALRDGTAADRAGLQQAKGAASRAAGIPVPSDRAVAALLGPDERLRHGALLRTKPQRGLSGVAVVAVMTSPAACPHGKCTFCPGGPDVGVPQSYTGFEPSTMRAASFSYDAYRIVRSRLGQLERNGHEVGKVEAVLQGGTFPARDDAYQSHVVAMVLAALNDGPGDGTEAVPVTEAAWSALDSQERAARLGLLMSANESAACRLIGLTVETKPDWCLEEHLDRMLAHGVTRIELGLQTLDEATLRATHRGHSLADSRRSMQLARDAGFKVCAHMMPGLPRERAEGAVGAWGGAVDPDPGMDRQDMVDLFARPEWRPDMIKVYPCLVVHEGETLLKRQWERGEFQPYDSKTAAAFVGETKGLVPGWCRIQRVDRDIPTTHVDAGVMNSNLRQMAEAWRSERGLPGCRCIRCREAGRRAAAGAMVDARRATLRRTDYEASGGLEAFLTFEDPSTDSLLAYLRLRRPGPGAHRSELQVDRGAAIVRELKVCGTPTGVGDDPEEGSFQHKGLGARLLKEAERVAFDEWRVGRLLVIAGPGVKPYYRRHGYVDCGPYIAKETR